MWGLLVNMLRLHWELQAPKLLWPKAMHAFSSATQLQPEEIYPLESEERLCDCFKTGDEAEIDMNSSTITRLSDGKVFSLKPIGAVAPVISAGGMFAYAREIGMIKS